MVGARRERGGQGREAFRARVEDLGSAGLDRVAMAAHVNAWSDEPATLWLTAHEVLSACGAHDEARRAPADGVAWVEQGRGARRVPPLAHPEVRRMKRLATPLLAWPIPVLALLVASIAASVPG